MIKSFRILFLLFASVLAVSTFTACGGDDDNDNNTVTPPADNNGKDDDSNGKKNDDSGKDNTTDDVVTGEVAEVSFTSATVYGYVNNETDRYSNFGIVYGTESDAAQLAKKGTIVSARSFDVGTDNRRFSVSLTGLKEGTTYYYYAFAGQKTANKVLSFTTTDIVVNTANATDVIYTSAVLHGSTNFTASSVGFIYGTINDSASLANSGYRAAASFTKTDKDDYEFTARLTNLASATTYYYYAFAGSKASSKILSFTTPVDYASSCPNANHPHAIDLGLPGGTKWACCNVGASEPVAYGLYFAWGETVGYTSDTTDGRSFNWTSYKWCNGSYNSLTKYCTDSSYGTVDNKTVLDLEDDAAHVNWGGSWVIPTVGEIEELLSNTTSKWITVNGVKGRKFTSNTNGNSVFLPAAGYRYNTYVGSQGSRGYYWSDSLYESDPGNARILRFYSGIQDANDSYRYYGSPVRPVLRN